MVIWVLYQREPDPSTLTVPAEPGGGQEATKVAPKVANGSTIGDFQRPAARWAPT